MILFWKFCLVARPFRLEMATTKAAESVFETLPAESDKKRYSERAVLKGDVDINLKKVFCTLLVDGNHGFAALKFLQNRELLYKSNRALIGVSLIFHWDVFPLSHRKIIFQGSIANKRTGFFFTGCRFPNNFNCIIWYAWGVEKEAGLEFSNARAFAAAINL